MDEVPAGDQRRSQPSAGVKQHLIDPVASPVHLVCQEVQRNPLDNDGHEHPTLPFCQGAVHRTGQCIDLVTTFGMLFGLEAEAVYNTTPVHGPAGASG